MLVKITGANKMYITKRYKRAYSVLNLKVLSTCLARGMIFENVGFFYETRKILPSFKEICRDRLSWQASIIVWTILMTSKSWWRLLKPKCLTLAIHHNKFIWFGLFCFSTFFILSDSDPYLLSYIYIYIYIYIYNSINQQKWCIIAKFLFEYYT